MFSEYYKHVKIAIFFSESKENILDVRVKKTL